MYTDCSNCAPHLGTFLITLGTVIVFLGFVIYFIWSFSRERRLLVRGLLVILILPFAVGLCGGLIIILNFIAQYFRHLFS